MPIDVVKPIVLPSGNTVPSLSEQDEYRLLQQREWSKKYPKLRHNYVAPKRRMRSWDVSTSGESTFRQNKTVRHQPKTIDETEQFRKDWRDRKGFQRDQAKSKPFCKCCITDSRAGHRAWVRNLLKKIVGMRVWSVEGEEDFREEIEELMSYDKDMFTSGYDCC